jgi:prophage regulatory protein
MKRGAQITQPAREVFVTKTKIVATLSDAAVLREAVRAEEPLGAFDARAVRELYQAAPANINGLRRTIRRSQLRQIVPLADSTIYELERRGAFPKRFFLTARCVVWDLQEILAWVEDRKRESSAAPRRCAPVPDVRQRKRRQVRGSPAS